MAYDYPTRKSNVHDNRTGKGSKDPRKKLWGMPGPIRDALVKADKAARRRTEQGY